jgi:hypothetical protein
MHFDNRDSVKTLSRCNEIIEKSICVSILPGRNGRSVTEIGIASPTLTRILHISARNPLKIDEGSPRRSQPAIRITGLMLVLGRGKCLVAVLEVSPAVVIFRSGTKGGKTSRLVEETPLLTKD